MIGPTLYTVLSAGTFDSQDRRLELCAALPEKGESPRTHQHPKFQRVDLRIPVKATMRSGAWRPLDPVDDDQGSA
jgi:hypothetical protein